MIDLSKFDNSDFTRGASAVKELCWWIVRSLVFAPWFPVPAGFKVFALRLFGAKIGSGTVIRSRVNVTFPWRFECGEQVWIGDEVTILSLAKVSIGSNVCISQRAYLCTGSHDFSKESFDLQTRPITVGDGCWIGAASFIGPGVVFGRGSRCLAGAVVVAAVPEGATVGGVPAKKIGC
jgi:putative colanic acid biosynthesis acetyltransferase WcaF